MPSLGDFQFAPLFPGTLEGVPRLCLAVRRKVDPAASWFVPLQDVCDAVVFLGAWLDGRQRVLDWLEIWVQSSQPETSVIPGETSAGRMANDNNAARDQRWRERAEILRSLHPESVVSGPWEEEPQPPMAYSPQEGRLSPVGPRGGSDGGAWRVCRDDAFLLQAGLPGYSSSSVRYLYVRELGSQAPLLALAKQAPRSPRVVSDGPEQGFPEDRPVFNREGGLLFIRRLAPLSLTQFKRILEGYGHDGIGVAADRIHLNPSYARFEIPEYRLHNHGLIFTGRQGRASRLMECLVLKLHAFREAVAAAADATQRLQRPFLTLQAADFRVRLHSSVRRLPVSWTFGVELARTTETVGLELSRGGVWLYRNLRPIPADPYRPPELATLRSGHCSLRVREIVEDSRGATLEGTLNDVAGPALRPSDVIELRLPLRGQRHSFWVRPLRGDSNRGSEIRVEGIPEPLPREVVDALGALRGIWTTSIPYEVLSIASAPADLYSLAVIGLEVLVDTRKVSLPAALDDLLLLARQLGRDTGDPLATRRARAVATEPRYQSSLGPVNLARESLESDADAFPAELWWAAMDLVMRMFPGMGPDSLARDLGDANPHALESVYADVLGTLDVLIEQGHGLLFGGVAANRELSSLLEEFAPSSPSS